MVSPLPWVSAATLRIGDLSVIGSEIAFEGSTSSSSLVRNGMKWLYRTSLATLQTEWHWLEVDQGRLGSGLALSATAPMLTGITVGNAGLVWILLRIYFSGVFFCHVLSMTWRFVTLSRCGLLIYWNAMLKLAMDWLSGIRLTVFTALLC